VNRQFSRSDFLQLGAGVLAAASLGSLPRRAEAAQLEVVYFDAETMSYPSLSGIYVVSDPNANFQKALEMHRRSSAFKYRVNFPSNANEVRIKARARSGPSGWPILAVLVDGREVGRWSVTQSTYSVPQAIISPEIAPGTHDVELRAVGGMASTGTAFVDFIQFRRPETEAPPPESPPQGALVAHGIYARGISTGTANPQWGDISQLADYTSLVGKKPHIVHGFQQFRDGIPVSGINNILANYPQFMLTLESGGLNLDQILSGQSDGDLSRIGQSLGSINHTIYVRLMHEMNGDWYSYSASKVSDGERKYREAFRRAVSRIKAGAQNVRFIWCPNVGAPVWTSVPYLNLYHGDDVVDILGLDGYAGYRPNPPLTYNLIFDRSVDEICAITPKPLWICEWGMDAWDYSAAEKEKFFDDARVALASQRYSRVKASLYFHSNQEGYRWKIDDPAASLDNYQRLVNDPVYQGTVL
jgi:mannan endo-1,4-beta-mannosidase